MPICQQAAILGTQNRQIMRLTRRALVTGVLALTMAHPARAGGVPTVRHLDGPAGVRTLETGAHPDTHFAIASVGKTMTAVAVLRRVAGGDLRLDAPVTRWIGPDLAEGFDGLPGITLRHLLTMRSGLPDYYTDDYLDDVLDNPALQTPQTALSYAHGDALLFGPGTRFDYCNTNYVLLGLILEAETGLSYPQVMQREVFDPARMTDSFVFGSRPLPASFADVPRAVRAYYQNAGFGDGGVIATAQDVARFYHALFRDQSLLPPAMLSVMTMDAGDAGYGMGIELDGPILGHSGGDLGFSSDVRLHRPSGTIAVMLVAEEEADTFWTDDQMPD